MVMNGDSWVCWHCDLIFSWWEIHQTWVATSKWSLQTQELSLGLKSARPDNRAMTKSYTQKNMFWEMCHLRYCSEKPKSTGPTKVFEHVKGLQRTCFVELNKCLNKDFNKGFGQQQKDQKVTKVALQSFEHLLLVPEWNERDIFLEGLMMIHSIFRRKLPHSGAIFHCVGWWEPAPAAN